MSECADLRQPCVPVRIAQGSGVIVCKNCGRSMNEPEKPEPEKPEPEKPEDAHD